jgi:SAM-dependent methyltransferase
MYIENTIDRILEKKFSIPSKSIDSTLFTLNLKMDILIESGLIKGKLKPVARSVTGIDISDGMLEKARQRGLNVTQADATAIPFPDHSFDMVYSFKVLAHVPLIRQAASEMVRVTRPGGVIAAEFYNSLSFRHLLKVLRAGTIAAGVTEKDVFLRFDTLDEFRSYFPADLDLVRVCTARHCLMSPVYMGLPGVGRFVRMAETVAAKTPMKVLGGFVTLVFRVPG